MKKRGFTLIELMGVITILGLIAILVAPTIINQIKKSRGQIDEVTKQLIFSATDLYLENKEDDYPKNDGATYCLRLKKIVDDGKLGAPILDSNGDEISLNSVVTVIVSNGDYTFKFGNTCYIDNVTIILNKNNVSINPGETFQLEAEVSDKDLEIDGFEYVSNNPNVATVTKDGLITGVKPGKAVITVTTVGIATITETVEVTVNDVDLPVYASYEVKNVTNKGYDVYIYGVTDASGISKVQFPTWTAYNNQDDLPENWESNSNFTGENQGNGTYYFRVDTTDHNGESGTYYTKIHIYDNYNKQTVVNPIETTVPSIAVTINVNDSTLGKVAPSAVTVGYGAKYTTNGNTITFPAGQVVTATTINPTGYTSAFDSWSSTSGTIIEDTTITARFTKTANTYKISYDANTGTSAPGDTTYTYAESGTIALSTAVPSKTGYTFQGWGTSKDDTTVDYSAGGAFNRNIAKNTTLYAIWTPNPNTKYVVNHYQMNTSGTYPTSATETENKTGTTDSTLTLSALAKSYTGFTYNSGKVGNNVVTTTTVAPDGSRVINLYYTRTKYTVSLTKGTGISAVSGAGDYYHGASVTIDATVMAGYEWKNWSGAHSTTTKQYTFTMPISNVSDTANASIVTYTISYNLDGGTVNPANPTSYDVTTATFKLTNPTKTGYTFLGWTGSNGNTASTNVSIAKGSTGNKSYTAKWQAKTITVTFNKNDGSGSTASQTFTYRQSGNRFGYNTDGSEKWGNTGQFGQWNRTGYTLLGWSHDPNATSATYSIYSGVSDDWINGYYPSTTLYAIWQVNTYTVQEWHHYYYLNTTWTRFQTTTDSRTYGSGFAPYNVSAPTGYYAANTYDYYYDNGDGTYTHLGSGTVGSNSFAVTQNMVVNVYYYPNTYTITQLHYYAYDNTTWTQFNSTTDSRIYGSTFAPYNVSAPTGYYARGDYAYYNSGWGHLGSGTIGSNSFTVTDNHPVQVFYSPYTYSITYHNSCGTGAPATQSYVYNPDANTTLSSTVPTCPGYTFLYWSQSTDGSAGQYYAGQGWWRGNTGNYNLYAVWADQTPPDISITAYYDGGSSYSGAWVTTQTVNSRTDFSDSGSGINPSSLAWSYDGSSWTYYSNSSTSVYYDTWGSEIDGYAYNRICDYAGNCNVASFRYRRDKTAPSISITAYYDSGATYYGEMVTTETINSRTNFSDGLSGINPSSLAWSYDGSSWTSYSNSSTSVYYDTWGSKINGYAYNRICDYAGNCNTASFRYYRGSGTCYKVTWNSGLACNTGPYTAGTFGSTNVMNFVVTSYLLVTETTNNGNENWGYVTKANSFNPGTNAHSAVTANCYVYMDGMLSEVSSSYCP